MKPVFWKLSMGPGTAGEDFKNLLEVLDWLRQGLVLVHKDTKAKGTSLKSQGQQFIESDRLGEYFYLCHGNEEPAVLLLGQFTSPANIFSTRGEGWAERQFRWIKTSTSPKSYKGEQKWWAPNHNSTFIMVPEEELEMFESAILGPYFEFALRDFRIKV
jgi:5-methylcytosine-specific restriction protein B